MIEHNELGKIGEGLAADYLIRKGYTILERNWRFQKAEIDIIAQNAEIVASIEVKTRSTNEFGNPQDFVNHKKIKLLVMAMNQYIIQKEIDAEVRFDIIAITKNKTDFNILHLEDAFLYF
mgnify:CR=1 FL=1|tara:strand:- start:164 stop:523 length:360 start_codon:yes stop_codon:yes gene_type:complete